MSRQSPIIKTIQENSKNLNVDAKALTGEILISLVDSFKDFTDVRYQPNCRHIFSEVLAIGFFGVLGGEDTWLDIEEFAKDRIDTLKKYLLLPAGIPSHDTIERCFKIIKISELSDLMVKIVTELCNKFYQAIEGNAFIDDKKEITDIIAIDGKAMLGSEKASSKYGEVKKLQMLNVYSTEYALCLSSEIVDVKTNEIPIGQSVLSMMNLKGNIITCDALNTQKELTKIIVNNKGQFCLALKANQGLLNNDLETYFNDKELLEKLKKDENSYYEVCEKSNSKVIVREYYSSNEVNWYAEINSWTGIKAFGYEIKKTTIIKTNEVIIEKRYFIVSFHDALLMSKAIRRHWHVENALHWHLDYTFKDDDNQTSDKEAARALSIVKRLVLSLLQIVKGFYKGKALRRIRKHIGRSPDAIDEFFKYLSASNHLIY